MEKAGMKNRSLINLFAAEEEEEKRLKKVSLFAPPQLPLQK